MKRVTRSNSGTEEFLELPSKPKRLRKTASEEQEQESDNSITLEQQFADPCIKMMTSSADIDENSNEVDSELIRQIESVELIRQILGYKYANIVDRLKLDWIPSCLNDCENHQTRANEAEYFKINLAKTLFFNNNSQHKKGLILFEDMVVSNVFPYPEIFQDLIRFILVSRFLFYAVLVNTHAMSLDRYIVVR